MLKETYFEKTTNIMDQDIIYTGLVETHTNPSNSLTTTGTFCHHRIWRDIKTLGVRDKLGQCSALESLWVWVAAPQLCLRDPAWSRDGRIDGIETGDSTCRLQRQVGEPKYILEAYTSPNYQATKYEAETTDSTAFQPCCPSEDVHETRILKHTNT